MVKGLVFTTFYEFCEERYGAEMLDDIIDDANLPHSGAYTSVGTYPFQEMVALITALVQHADEPMPALMEQFGAFCFQCWVKKFPELFDARDLFDVLASIDDFHESEVRRLYPDAELPSFSIVGRSPESLSVDYRSCKPLADLALGVIRGAAAHLNTPVQVSYSKVDDRIRFLVQRVSTARIAA